MALLLRALGLVSLVSIAAALAYAVSIGLSNFSNIGV